MLFVEYTKCLQQDVVVFVIYFGPGTVRDRQFAERSNIEYSVQESSPGPEGLLPAPHVTRVGSWS